MEPKLTVCVDLDGVLATYDGWKGIDHIGEPRPGAAGFMANLRQRYIVVVFTTRCKLDMGGRGDGETPDTLAARVRAWLERHAIEFDDVYTGQGKPFYAALVDDRAVGIPSNPGVFDFANALLEVARVAK